MPILTGAPTNNHGGGVGTGGSGGGSGFTLGMIPNLFDFPTKAAAESDRDAQSAAWLTSYTDTPTDVITIAYIDGNSQPVIETQSYVDGIWRRVESVIARQGPIGQTGAVGDSAYQDWLDVGNSGTFEDFLSATNNADFYGTHGRFFEEDLTAQTPTLLSPYDVHGATNSFHFGDAHEMSSGGDNFTFLNKRTQIPWHPLWQGTLPIRADSPASTYTGAGVIPAGAVVYTSDAVWQSTTLTPHIQTDAGTSVASDSGPLEMTSGREYFGARFVFAENRTLPANGIDRFVIRWSVGNTANIDDMTVMSNLTTIVDRDIVAGEVITGYFDSTVTLHAGTFVRVELLDANDWLNRIHVNVLGAINTNTGQKEMRPDTPSVQQPWYDGLQRSFEWRSIDAGRMINGDELNAFGVMNDDRILVASYVDDNMLFSIGSMPFTHAFVDVTDTTIGPSKKAVFTIGRGTADETKVYMNAPGSWIIHTYQGAWTASPTSIRGATGETGADGASAFDIWLIANPTGTINDYNAAMRGTDGADGGTSAVYITNVTANGGTVMNIVRRPGTMEVISYDTDAPTINVEFSWERNSISPLGSIPTSTLGDVLVTSTPQETISAPLITGQISNLVPGTLDVTLGTTERTATFNEIVAPTISSVNVSYPLGQSSVKAGDQITFEIEADEAFDGVVFVEGVTVNGLVSDFVSGSTVTISHLVDSTANVPTIQQLSVRSAATGATSSPFEVSVSVDNTVPTISMELPSFPDNQFALKSTEQSIIQYNVSDASSVNASVGSGLTGAILPADPIMAGQKYVTVVAGSDDNMSAGNVALTAMKASNGTQAFTTALVRVSNTIPIVDFAAKPDRLKSTDAGQTHMMLISSNVPLYTWPTFTADIGTVGAYNSQSGVGVTDRSFPITIDHADKGNGTRSLDVSLSTGPSGIPATTNTLNKSYTVGGFDNITTACISGGSLVTGSIPVHITTASKVVASWETFEGVVPLTVITEVPTGTVSHQIMFTQNGLNTDFIIYHAVALSTITVDVSIHEGI